ncbi:unnamed protein product [Caretta caretta]
MGKQQSPTTIETGNEEAVQEKEFCYLGFTAYEDKDCTKTSGKDWQRLIKTKSMRKGGTQL